VKPWVDFISIAISCTMIGIELHSELIGLGLFGITAVFYNVFWHFFDTKNK